MQLDKFLSTLFWILILLQIWVRKTSDSTKMRIYLGQLQRGAFIIRRRSAAQTSRQLPLLFPVCTFLRTFQRSSWGFCLFFESSKHDLLFIKNFLTHMYSIDLTKVYHEMLFFLNEFCIVHAGLLHKLSNAQQQSERHVNPPLRYQENVCDCCFVSRCHAIICSFCQDCKCGVLNYFATFNFVSSQMLNKFGSHSAKQHLILQRRFVSSH